MINENLYTSVLFSSGKKINISNVVTILRIVITPFIVSNIILHRWASTLFLFIFAILTDVIDGSIARYLKEETVLGAYLDPLADKFLLISCYVSLAFIDFSLFKIPLWFVIIIALKEFLLIFSAVYFGIYKHKITVKATFWGKLTTVVQVLFILLIFLCSKFYFTSNTTFHILLLVICLLSIGTLLHYLYIGYKGLKT